MPYKFNPFTGQLDYYQAGSGGEVIGPASATDNAIARFDGATGRLIQNSAAFIDDSGNLGLGTPTPNNTIQVIDLINFNNTDFNTFIGYQAGKNLVVGAQNNTYLGYRAGLSSAASSTNAADSNTGIGYQALMANTSGPLNTAVGYSALTANLSGSANTAIGYESLLVNATGFNNVAIGRGALKANIGGSGNVAVGINAMIANQSGVDNFGLGTNSLGACISGADNVAIGRTCLQLTTGSSNVGIGRNALNAATGSANIGIGYYAGAYETGSNAFYLGNGDMGTSAGDKANALMYGVMSPGSGANFQTLQVNAKIGAGIAPTAFLTLRAGSATATRAPLKFTSGTLLTTAEAGACEFLTDKFYATITTGAARKELALNDIALTSGRVPFATTNGRLTDDADFTFAIDTLTVTKIAATTLTGNQTYADAINMAFNVTTGTKIGTATTQKLAFWNAAPIVQPTAAIAAATFVANTSGIANDTATFDGYTIGQIVKALRNEGLLA